MYYNEILKQRRLALKLSIQDVSDQTRLAPEYIQAIEENNLEVFSDDLSFVRYFVQAYCQAIGVNWNALQPEVDGSIKYYAHLKNMALTQAQKKMVQTMPQAGQDEAGAKKNRKQRKKSSSKAKYQSRVNRTTKRLTGQKKRKVSWQAVTVVCLVLAALFGINWFYSQYQATLAENARTAKEQEILAKEEETAQLAALRQQALGLDEKNAQSVTQDGNNVQVVMSLPGQLKIKAVLDQASLVYLEKGDQLLTDENAYYENLDQTIEMDQAGTVILTVYGSQNMSLEINGTPVNVAFDENWSARVEIQVRSDSDQPAQDTQSQTGTDQETGNQEETDEPAE